MIGELQDFIAYCLPDDAIPTVGTGRIFVEPLGEPGTFKLFFHPGLARVWEMKSFIMKDGWKYVMLDADVGCYTRVWHGKLNTVTIEMLKAEVEE